MSEVTFEQLAVLWDDGERRLRATAGIERRRLDQIVETVVDELRRRLGGRFGVDQLAELYLTGTEWCFDIATRVAPDAPELWDMSTVVGAAFARQMRRAMDYGGGRRRLEEDGPERPDRER